MDNVKEGKTTAIVAYLTIIGSLIAITMNMEPKNDFARFHPAGTLGKKLILKIESLMYCGQDLPFVTPDMLFYSLDIWIFRCFK
jgi:hypothetical protein